MVVGYVVVWPVVGRWLLACCVLGMQLQMHPFFKGGVSFCLYVNDRNLAMPAHVNMKQEIYLFISVGKFDTDDMGILDDYLDIIISRKQLSKLLNCKFLKYLRILVYVLHNLQKHILLAK